MKHITLIWPNMGYLKIKNQIHKFSDEAGMEPLPLAVIASLFPEDFEIKLFDDRYEAIPYDTPTDLVCISIEIFTARRGYEIADEFRKRGVKVLIGGMHPSLMPAEVKQHADSILIGDAEPVFSALVNDLRNNNLQPVYKSGVANQIPGIYPRRELYKKLPYLPIMLLQFGRGCPYSCTFCAISACFRQTHTVRPVNDVIREIEQDGRKLLFFVDDNIIANPKAAKELFKALIPLRIKWMGQASIDMALDDELLDLMNKSGCLGHVIGFESINANGLELMNKQVNLRKFDSYSSAIRNLYKHGIQIWAALVIGSDTDTPQSLKETLQFCMHHKFAFGAFNILMPYPGTPFYDQLKSQNRLLYDNQWWLHPDYTFNQAAFIPQHFSPEGLAEACQQLKNEYNSYGSIIRRVIKAAATRKTLSSATFLMRYGYLFRTETFKKKYLKLG